MTTKLKAPFPWFGGKSRVAHVVWERFGDVPNYVEPFFGSGAVLLCRQLFGGGANRIETVNDRDCYLSNFWRAITAAPDQVALHADWPVNEADLHARHRWLHAQKDFRTRMENEPEFFDAKIAGYWVWGLSAWIGDNWCRPKEQSARTDVNGHSAGKGVNARMPNVDGFGAKGVHGCVDVQIPHLSHAGMGVNSRVVAGDGSGLDHRRPHLSSAQGVHKKRPSCSRTNSGRGPHKLMLSGNGHGVGIHADRGANLMGYFCALAERLRRVRVCCGDWLRVMAPSVTRTHGVTAVFLDPPYGVEDRDKVYNHDSLNVAGDVRAWCVANGHDVKLRVALCGYDGEHNVLERFGWTKSRWKAVGGYGAVNPENENAKRERIWFSPHCRKVGLFE